MLHQLFYADVRIIDVCADGVAALGKVVRCHIGGHTHGDAGRTVEQEQRGLGRQNCRLLEGVVEVQGHIHRVLVEVTEYLLGKFFQFRLGVSHRSYRVAVH